MLRLFHAHRVRITALGSLLVVAACSPADTLTGPSPRNSIQTAPLHDPILFVHGWMSTSATWNTMVSRFKTDGWTDAELSTFTYNTSQSNATTAQTIKTKVDSILAATGARRVDIVTHSMGTLSAHYYIKYLGGDRRVDALVSLGGTNHGTATASLCKQVSCVEMRLNSSFITSLNAGDETWGPSRYGTWWSPCDEVIIPQTSTILSGASNTQTACMQHSDLHEDLTVYSQVKAWVAP